MGHLRQAFLAGLLLLLAAAPARADGPRRTERAYVGVYLKTIRNLHANEGTFEAQLRLSVRWRGSSGLDPGEITLDNAMHIEREEIDRTTEGAWTSSLWNVSGTFHGRFALKNFPFDQHQLTLSIAHPSLSSGALRLEPDLARTGVAPDLDIPGWIFEPRFAAFQEAAGGRSEVRFQIFLLRPLFSLLTKILLPLLLCLAMGHSAFWLDPQDTSSRLMMVSMAIFSAVCVHFTLGETVPDVGQLVIADYYVFLVYALLFGYVVGGVIAHRLVLKGRMQAVEHLDRAVRWGFPLALAAVAYYVSIPEGRRPVPPAPRPVSAVSELVIGTAQEPKNLGLGAEGGVEKFYTGLFLRPLASLDDRWELRPELAGAVPSFANGLWELRQGGGAAVRWVLRPGALWADGKPVVPQDFTATHKAFPYHGARSVELTEDGAVIEYDQPRLDALFDVPLLPAHQPDGRSGAGPFVLERWTPGQELLLARNPHYPHGPASLGRIHVRFFPTKPDLLAAVRRREIGLVPQGDLNPEEAEGLAQELPSMTARVVDSTVLWHLEVNLDDPLLADVRLRQALLLGTDREAMIRRVAKGRGEVAHSWLPVQHEGYDPDLRRYAYDPQAAAALLEAAGYQLGAAGSRQGPDGTPLRLTVAALPSRRAEVEFLQQAWKRLGIEVIFEEVPHDRFLGEYTARRQFRQLAFYGFLTTPFETGRKRWDQDRIPSEQNGWSGENLTGWRNARVSEIHRRIETMWSSEERVELYAEQQALWAEALPVLPLYTAKSAILHDARLKNVQPHPSERAYLSWNAEAWYFEP